MENACFIVLENAMNFEVGIYHTPIPPSIKADKPNITESLLRVSAVKKPLPLHDLRHQVGFRSHFIAHIHRTLHFTDPTADGCGEFHLQEHGIPRPHHLLEFTVIYLEEIGIILPFPAQVNGEYASALCQCLDLEYTRHDGIAREMALEEPFVEGDILHANYLRIAELYNLINKQKRKAMRQLLLDIA